MTETRNDSWTNAVTGIGGPLDKSAGFLFTPLFISEDFATLEFLYDEDHLAGKICDALPEDVFRRGWETSVSDEALREPLTDECDRLGLEDAVDQAMRWEALYGGAAIFIGADDGQSITRPLNEQGVSAVHFLNVYDRWELTPHSYYTQQLSPKFGRPELYRVHPRSAASNVGMLIHESRLIIFGGRPTTKTRLVANQFWGQSRLVRAYTSVKNYGGALASTLALVADSNQGVYKIKGLAAMIQAGKSKPLKERFRALQEIRSIVNSIVLDADGESYERVATPLTEIANIVDRFKLDVASAAEMPVTRLFGQAPAGLNATGESDMRNWYDRVEQVQRRRVKPAMERVIRLVLRSRNGITRGREPEKWAVKFPTPWRPTAKEAADIRKVDAETDAIYVDLGVLTVAQVARGRFGGEENTSITLRPEELAALEGRLGLGGAAAPAGALPTVEAPTPPALETTLDDEDVAAAPAGEPLDLVEARALAAKMSELRIGRCEHGKVNRCPLCRIQRSRDVALGANGEPEWSTSWRAIGDTAPVQATSDDASGESTSKGAG